MNTEITMRPSKFYLAFAIVFLLTLSANAQFYPVLSTERIYTPWDTDTTLIKRSSLEIISLTEDGRLGIFSLDTSDNISRFYFYDNVQKLWYTKELVTNRKSNSYYKVDYSFGMKEVLNYENLRDDSTKNNCTFAKWILNFGTSVYNDSISHYSNATLYFTSPSVYYLNVFFDMGEKRDLEYQDGYIRSNNARLYRMPNPGMQSPLLDLAGGAKGMPEYSIHYFNSIKVVPLDAQYALVGVDRFSKSVTPGSYSFAEYYTLLVNSNTNSQDRITNGYIDFKPRQNIDRQWFFKLYGSTMLYSSPRHGISPNKPVGLSYIDKPLQNVTISSEYANGSKEYYCLCNSDTEDIENDKFLIYSIGREGQFQKFIIPDSIFEYPDVPINDTSSMIDSSCVSKQIIYADDSVLYVRVTAKKSTGKNSYYSLPQIYKIQINKIATSIFEQDASLPAVHPYPNPTDETINWKPQSGIASITDALGRKLIEVPASVLEADVSGLPVGVYFLTIRNGVASTTSSFVVAR